MKYTESDYKELSKRFNEKSFLGKILLIKQQAIFQLEVDDCSNFFLRLNDEDAQIQGMDLLFKFPQQLNGKDLKEIFDLGGINLKIV